MPTFETPGHVKLDLIVPAGAVTVGPWGEPRVEISVTPIRGDDASVQAAAETRIEAVARGGRHEVSVRVPKRAKQVRVTYAVSARDDVDGAVPVSCSPRSGSRFSIGRTLVICSASDGSANTGTARFAVTVKRRR